MEIFLTICLIATFTSTGGSLKCPICDTNGRNCDGPMKTCSLGYEQCAIISSEKSLGTQNRTTTKKCIKPDVCHKSLAVLNMGKNGTILSYVFCCVGEDCKKPPLSLPPRVPMPLKEKRTCPACYSENKGCIEETIECDQDDETHCAELFYQTSDTEGKNVTTTMKGCTNKVLCDNPDVFVIGHLLPESHCKLAKSEGNTIQGFFGLLLLAQVQLLRGQVLP